MSLVLDASVALSWCLADEDSDYADGVLAALRFREAVVPHHWALEVGNGLLAAQRRGRIERAEVPRVVELLSSLPLYPDPATRGRDLKGTVDLALEHGLSNYDAAYLELARRFGIPLATLDGSLGTAADQAGVGRFLP